MTRLTTYPNLIELATYDTLLEITDLTDYVRIFSQHEVDWDITDEATVTFKKDEFKALVELLYVRYVQGYELTNAMRNFDA